MCSRGAIRLALGAWYVLDPPFDGLRGGAGLGVASFAALTAGAVAAWLARQAAAVRKD